MFDVTLVVANRQHLKACKFIDKSKVFKRMVEKALFASTG